MKTLRRKKEQKIDITRKGVDGVQASSVKSPRRIDDRNIFDFSVKRETGSEGHYGRSTFNSSREVLDFTSGRN